jgi:hypothetical protein
MWILKFAEVLFSWFLIEVKPNYLVHLQVSVLNCHVKKVDDCFLSCFLFHSHLSVVLNIDLFPLQDPFVSTQKTTLQSRQGPKPENFSICFLVKTTIDPKNHFSISLSSCDLNSKKSLLETSFNCRSFYCQNFEVLYFSFF